jgi:hypothetical protein
VASELRARVRKHITRLTDVPPPARSAGDLRIRAESIRLAWETEQAVQAEAERKRREKEAEHARRARMASLELRGDDVWRELETEIERRNPPGYDKAAEILFDLRAIAEEKGETKDFARRLDAIRGRHAGKWRFIERLETLG